MATFEHASTAVTVMLMPASTVELPGAEMVKEAAEGLFSRTLAVSALEFAVARSVQPSLSKSAARMEKGFERPPYVMVSPKAPEPVPGRMLTSPEP